jgi:hypothetical protein
MKRLLATLGIGAALAFAAAPANADQGPGDPSGENCDEINSLATSGFPGAGVTSLASGTTTDTLAKLFPVHFVGSDGGCTIDVSGPP